MPPSSRSTDTSIDWLMNESLFHAMLSNAWASIVVMDTDHRMLVCNDLARAVFEENGHTVVIGSDVRTYFQRANVPAYIEAGEKALRGETTIVERTRVINGKNQWLRHKLAPFRNTEGTIVGYTLFSINIDVEIIAERDKEIAEQQLEERVKELRILYFTSETLRDEKQDLHFALAKIAAEIPRGWQFPEVCAARIIFESAEHTSGPFSSIHASQKADFTTLDGKKGTVEVVYTEEKPCADEGPFLKEERDLINSLAEMIGVHYNERAAHAELRKSEANLRSVFESTEVGHMLLDRQFRIVAFNSALQYGYAEGTGVILKPNVNFLDVLKPDRRVIVLDHIAKINATLKPVQYDTTFERKGETYHFFVGIHPVLGQNKEVIGYCFSAADITQRKKLELERERVINDLLQRNKDLEQFAFIVSHNIRAPLANILGLTKLFDYDLKPDDHNKAMSGIKISANRLDEVLGDVNRILQSKRTITELKTLVKLDDLMREVLSGLQDSIRRTNTHIEYDFPADASLITLKSALLSIFINLITNSIKFAKPGERPQIKIWSETIGSSLTIHFKDSGIGLDMGQFGNQLFGLYKRFALHIEGKGIGLYMVKTQADIIDGQLSVQSRPNEGMQISLRLRR